VSCRPERVTGYVDDTLEPGERAEIESHLATCSTCRQQADAERALRDALRGTPLPEPPAELEARVRGGLARAARPGRWLLPFAACVALLALWARGAAPFVAWELARDHARCFGKPRLPAAVWSGDPHGVTDWFEAQGTHLPLVPGRAAGLDLLGGRYCPLLDRFAAHLYYGDEDRHLSLFVIQGPVRFEHTWATLTRGRPVRLLQVGGTIVGLVGERPEDVEAFRSALQRTIASLERPNRR
jgi:anti-sigma factor RsiW